MPSPRRAALRLWQRSRAVEDADPYNKKSLPPVGEGSACQKTSLWEGGGPKGRRERASPLPETFVPA